MFDTFYLLARDEGNNSKWYNLCIRDTHFCTSCGSNLDKILIVLKKYVKTYKNKDRLMRALNRLDGGGRVSPATFSQREEQFRKEGHLYSDLIHRTIEEAFKEAREEEKLNSPMNKAKTRLKKAGGIKSISIEEVLEPAPVEHKVLPRKPKLIKRK